MTKPSTLKPILLRWSEHVPVSDVQDPLGLSLRGSARLASRLLYCITSITPRARYFSFIPWCVQNWQEKEKGRPFAVGLSDAIALRERALTLGCVAHHDGKPCTGGALVGSDNVAIWFRKGFPDVDLRKLPFAKNPALAAYFTSLVNLGFFVVEDETIISEESEDEVTQTFDDIKLSPLGTELAKAYERRVGRLDSVAQVSTMRRRCTVNSLSLWGSRGGLCELADASSPDRNLLRDIFFARNAREETSHFVRSRSLLLILHLARSLSKQDAQLDEQAFGLAVYFGEIDFDDGDKLTVKWPLPLLDIATRWRMFYFHHYMSVALEGAFAWLVTQTAETGLRGTTIKQLCGTLNSPSVRKELATILGRKLEGPFGTLTPMSLLEDYVDGFVSLDANTSKVLNDAMRPTLEISETYLEDLIRARTFPQSRVGLAIPMLLLGITLSRFAQWEGTPYGNWLASVSTDPYVDIVPPALNGGLSRRFGAWWKSSWVELAEFVLSKYVVQQHQTMSYEKTAKGDRCLLQVDGDRITTRPNEVYEQIGMGNARFHSAVRILKDLGLLSDNADGITSPTEDGAQLLDDRPAIQGPV